MAENTIRNIRPYYSISCTISGEEEDVDLSQNLMSVSILSSVNSPYQTVITSFIMDSKILVRKDLFGKGNMNLEIQLMSEGVVPTENVKLELLTIRQDVPLSMKNPGEVGLEVQDVLTVINVVKTPYIQMSTTVNKLFDESHQKTPVEMVESIVTDFLPDMATNIISTNNNTERIYQYIVPPMNFMDSVRFIDGSNKEIMEKYGPGVGIFNGPLFFSNRFEIDGTNTFCMWDIGAMMSGDIEYTIYQLATGGDDDDIMEKAGVENNIFYTRNDVNHVYRGNQDIMGSSYINKFLSKPSDKLYENVELSMDDVFENAVQNGGEIDVNESLKTNYSHRNILEVGLETSNAPYMARMSRKISSLSEIEIYIDRNLSIEKLSRVGVPIEFVPKTADYIDMSGRYIVGSSRITFNRETDSWVCRARIRSARANLKSK